MHDEFCSAHLRQGLCKRPHACRFPGTDIEHESAGACCPHSAAQRTDGIVDKSEIAGLLAITKNLDRFAAKQPVGENRDHSQIWRRRILPRPIKVEKAQPDRQHPMYRTGDAGVELASMLICAIGAERRYGALLVDREVPQFP